MARPGQQTRLEVQQISQLRGGLEVQQTLRAHYAHRTSELQIVGKVDPCAPQSACRTCPRLVKQERHVQGGRDPKTTRLHGRVESSPKNYTKVKGRHLARSKVEVELHQSPQATLRRILAEHMKKPALEAGAGGVSKTWAGCGLSTKTFVLFFKTHGLSALNCCCILQPSGTDLVAGVK